MKTAHVKERKRQSKHDELIESFREILLEQFGRKPEDLVGFIYLVRCGEFVKIGMSKDASARLRVFQKLFPVELSLEHTLRVADMYLAERWLHQRFADKRVRNEWFRLDVTDVAWIRSLTDGFYTRQ